MRKGRGSGEERIRMRKKETGQRNDKKRAGSALCGQEGDDDDIGKENG